MDKIKGLLYSLATDRNKGVAAGILKFCLWILSLVYSAAVRLVSFASFSQQARLDCKVISIGNITLGGTGKTSLVEYVARYLKQEGRKIAILSRGYKKSVNCQEMGDEPFMLSRNLENIPVLVGADRAGSAKLAIKEYSADTVILDDGMQQWKIKKDLEIITIDATNPFGNGFLIPRGILREPLSSLRRADVFVLTKSNLGKEASVVKETLNEINPAALVVESIHKPLGFYELGKPGQLLDIKHFSGKAVNLFSGIASPESFEALIKSLGIRVGSARRFPDHHNFSDKDIQEIINNSKALKTEIVITTQKDASRLAGLKPENNGVRFFVLRIELAIKDEQRFSDRLLKLYRL